MKLVVENLYEHADGGIYCLLSEDAPYKDNATGDWLDGVIYMSTDGRMRSTTRGRWVERFTQIPYYDGEDEAVINMIRRCNPGDLDLDFMRIFESWHKSEMDITGHMLELAVGATLERASSVWWVESNAPRVERIWDKTDPANPRHIGIELTIRTEDLQRVAQNYEIERVPEPHGFKFVMRKSFPEST